MTKQSVRVTLKYSCVCCTITVDHVQCTVHIKILSSDSDDVNTPEIKAKKLSELV